MLAACSDKWALVRSLTHPYNEHSIGHHVMLTGRTPTPVGFNSNRPTIHDFPSIASVVNRVVPPHNNLPPAVLPEKLIHVTGRTIPGQFAGEMGDSFDPWLIEASQYRDTNYTHGAFPEYGFQRPVAACNPEATIRFNSSPRPAEARSVPGATPWLRCAPDRVWLTTSRPGTRHYHPAVSPDGQWILFGSDRSGIMQLYVATINGDYPRPVTNVPAGHCAMHGHWQRVLDPAPHPAGNSR